MSVFERIARKKRHRCAHTGDRSPLPSSMLFPSDPRPHERHGRDPATPYSGRTGSRASRVRARTFAMCLSASTIRPAGIAWLRTAATTSR